MYHIKSIPTAKQKRQRINLWSTINSTNRNCIRTQTFVTFKKSCQVGKYELLQFNNKKFERIQVVIKAEDGDYYRLFQGKISRINEETVSKKLFKEEDITEFLDLLLKIEEKQEEE